MQIILTVLYQQGTIFSIVEIGMTYNSGKLIYKNKTEAAGEQLDR